MAAEKTTTRADLSIVLLSGKRAAGKDYVGEVLVAEFGEKAKLCRLGDVVKRDFAQLYELDFSRLISQDQGDRAYKEEHRELLTEYYNTNQPSVDYLVANVIAQATAAHAQVAVVCDYRAPLEQVKFEALASSVVTVRVNASDEARRRHGWVYHEAKDTSVTETGLDSKTDWDFVINNDEEGPERARALHHQILAESPDFSRTHHLSSTRQRAGLVTTTSGAGSAGKAQHTMPSPAAVGTVAATKYPREVIAMATEELSVLFDKATGKPRRTLIVASLGPSSWLQPVLEGIVAAGSNVVRLNCSHRTAGAFEEMIPRLAALKAATGVQVLGDLQGPKFRVSIVQGGEAELQRNAFIQLAIMKDDKDLSCNYRLTMEDTFEHRALIERLEVGTFVLIDDGKVTLTVVERKSPTQVKCKVMVSGMVSSHKGVNVVGQDIVVPALTLKDTEDLALLVSAGILDYIAFSFVQTAADVADLLAALDSLGVPPSARPKVIAKIETRAGVANADAILGLADGLMVARGDMGVELGLAKVPLIQKRLIKKCLAANKFVITATQMLESMTTAATPTRAEVSDVANAVLDGSHAVMLSAESASGKHPVAAVAVMASIIVEIESEQDAGLC